MRISDWSSDVCSSDLSTGVAMLDSHGTLQLRRAVGKVVKLEEKLRESPCHGQLGIAHSRWATHGGVTAANAHPHVSGGRIALIHNGIIEKYVEQLGRASCRERG